MQFIQAANHWNGREGQKAKYLIIHGTAGGASAVAIANYFVNPATQASTHYVVGTDGTVVQCVAESDAAWANGGISGPASSAFNRSGSGNGAHDAFWDHLNGVNPNLVCISIEHCKPSSDNSDQITAAQKQASFQLVKAICTRNNIPMKWADENGGITGHYSLDPVNRARCPGPYPWSDLFTFLQETQQPMPITLSTPGVSAHFKGDDSHWQCSNGFIVAYGILGFYRSFGNDAINGLTYLGLPLSNESYPKPNTAVQVFERGIIAYDPGHVLDNPPGSGNSYLMHTDQGYGQQLLQAGLLKQVADAQAAANTAKADLVALKAQPRPSDQAKAALTTVAQAIQTAIQSLG